MQWSIEAYTALKSCSLLLQCALNPFIMYLIIFGFIDMLTDILNIDHVVNIIRNAFDLGVLLYCYQVYVCKLTVKLSITRKYWQKYFTLA